MVFAYICESIYIAPLLSYVYTYTLTAWGGRYCESDRNGCSEINCFEGVQCYDVPAPGSGAICEHCSNGYIVYGEKCAGTL